MRERTSISKSLAFLSLLVVLGSVAIAVDRRRVSPSIRWTSGLIGSREAGGSLKKAKVRNRSEHLEGEKISEAPE